MILSPPIVLLIVMTICVVVVETASTSSESMNKRKAGNIRRMRQLSDSYNSGGYGGDTNAYDSGASSYDSYGGGGGGGEDSYGASSYDSYGGGGGDSYGDSSYDSYGGGDSSYGGGADSYDSYGGGGYGDSSGYGDGSAGYQPPSKFSKFIAKINVKVPLIPALIIAGFFVYIAMVFTAFMYQIRPESTFTNCCRCSINAAKTLYTIFYHLARCRLGEIPPIVCAMDDDDLSDDELERMKPRPKLEEALNVEHKKAVEAAKGGKVSSSSGKFKLPKIGKKPSPDSNNDKPVGSMSSSVYSKLPTFGKKSSESKPFSFKANLFG